MSSFVMRYLFIMLLLTSLASCNNNGSTDSAAPDVNEGSVHAGAGDTIVTGVQPFVLTGCYEMTLKKDSAFLSLAVNDTLVTGELQFKLFEKDNNEGTVKGVLRNNFIHADYTIQSEGITSVREIIFQIKDGTLLQAYGDLKEQNGKFVFADRNNLQYQTANQFIKVTCPAE